LTYRQNRTFPAESTADLGHNGNVPKPVKRKRLDPNEAAFATIQALTADTRAPIPTPDEVSRVMAALGRKGGTVSGAKRMQNLSAAKRKAIARKGGLARAAKRKAGQS
jgi:hypothetical protein